MNHKSIKQSPNATKPTQTLLRANPQLMFLPAGCEDLQDSHYEPYLDCYVPEGAIVLESKGKGRVGVGNGCVPIVLLRTKAAGLTFTPSTRDRVPAEVARILHEQFESLTGKPNQGCALRFVEWLYDKRPLTKVALLEYFLSKPDDWLIGLPGETQLRDFFSQPPLGAGPDGSTIWYSLRHLQPSENDLTKQPGQQNEAAFNNSRGFARTGIWRA